VANGNLSLNGSELHADVASLARAANFAAVSTLLNDGRPQTQVTWVDVDADASRVLVNTLPFTQKFRNVRRDPRITVLIWDREDPEHYVEVRGRVVETIDGQAALDHAGSLAERYLAGPYRGPGQRVLLRIQASRQVVRRRPYG
jgi:PPOX class probable F420-dependent enzyme